MKPARSVCVFVLVGLLSALTATAAELPPPPKDEAFVVDLAGILQPDTVKALAEPQRRAFEEHDVPIIVVTIPSMQAYGGGGTIEEFAQRWFDHWRIGTMDREDGHNRGMMLLVSLGDRKARIELGADWERRWDDQAKRIMEEAVIPHFKKADFDGGILAGVESMADMASHDPTAKPEVNVISDVAGRLKSKKPLTKLSPVPGNIGVWVLLAGVLLCVLSAFVPGHRKMLLIAGLVLIAVPLIMWVLLVIVGLFMKGRGGGFSSGGGFSGGFSGGGGASGSW